MESQVSPKNIETRVDAMAKANEVKPVETPAASETKAPEAKAPEAKAPEAKVPEAKAPEAKAPEAKVPEVKAPEAKVPEAAEKPAEKKQPNDPAELRKWSTKLSQENAALREDMKTIKAALDKLTKKPVDYAELAKNPDSLKAHIEAERQEAIKEMTEKYVAARDTAVANETQIERMKMERDTTNFPRFEKLFPLIQTLANNGDGRINWNQPPRAVLEQAYALAEQLNPPEVVAAIATPAAPVVPAAPAVTEEQIQARIAEAVAKAKADAEAGIREEVKGGGLGSAGRGGKRDGNVNTDALKKMPLKDLKAMVMKE